MTFRHTCCDICIDQVTLFFYIHILPSFKIFSRHNLFDIGLMFCVGAHNINKLEFLRERWFQNLFFILFILEDPLEALETGFVAPLMSYITYILSMMSDGWFAMGENIKGDMKSTLNAREYVMKEV